MNGDLVMSRLDGIERTVDDDPPAIDHGDVVADALDLVEQVRREEHGPAVVGDGADDRAEDVSTDDGVET